MRILIDDKPVDGLTAKRERSLVLGRAQDEVKGAVLTPAEATETYVRQTKRWFTILAVIALVLMAAISIAGISYEPRDGAFIAVGVVVIGGGLLLFMRLLLDHRVRTWNRKLAHRVEGLAPPGTAIQLDAQGVSVGTEIFDWPSLAIEIGRVHQRHPAPRRHLDRHHAGRAAIADSRNEGVRARPRDDAERHPAGRQLLAAAARRAGLTAYFFLPGDQP